MEGVTRETIEVWAQLFICKPDGRRLREFFVTRMGINSRFVFRDFHLTVYHARRPMRGITPRSEPANVVVPATAMRFMVLAPGGENARPELKPADHMIGVRIQRVTPALQAILTYRDKILAYEDSKILGRRAPSNDRRNAFGARHFQPHIALLRPQNGLADDLRNIGAEFRGLIGELTFDQFEVKVVRRNGRARNDPEPQAG